LSLDELENSRLRTEVSGRAFGWLAEQRDRFVPTAWSSVPLELFARKAFTELALLIGLAFRYPDRVPEDARDALWECVASVSERSSYKELVARDPPALPLYAATYAALRLAGSEDPEFRWAIEQLVGGRYATVIERSPYRHLELLHTLDAAGIRHDLPGVDQVLPFTVLFGDPSIVEVRDSDAYAVTHTLFYATDFGSKDVRWPPGYDLARASELLDALLMLYRVKQNPDLTAELICSLACLNIHHTPEMARAWAYLSEVQCDDGRVPGPAEVIESDVTADASSREWLMSYHTTIVTALAGLLVADGSDGARIHAPSPDPLDPRLAGQVREALRRGIDWVCGELQSLASERAIPLLSATAAAACVVGVPSQLAVRFREAVVQIEEEGTVDWSTHGSDVVVTFARSLDELGIECTSLRAFLEFLARTLEREPTARYEAPAVGKLLGELGLLPPPAADSGISSDVREEFVLTPGAHPVEIATRLVRYELGNLAPREEDQSQRRAIAEALGVALTDACREYRLGEAAALLRGLLVLGWAYQRVTVDAVRFLLRQQTLTGGFGYTASDDTSDRAADQRRWTQSLLVALSDFLRADGESGCGSRRPTQLGWQTET
jgi:hypothetical protein